MVANVIIWHRLLADRVKRGVLEPEVARRFTRGAAFWLVAPCLALGSIALTAGWSDPLCAGILSFRDVPSAATSLVILGLWTILLSWLWLGHGAIMLSQVFSALTDRAGDRAVSPAVVRLAATAVVVANGLGAVIAPPPAPEGCAFTPRATSTPHMPGMQITLAVLFAATWLIGGNLLVAKHYRRMGKSPWSGFVPFAFPFKDFNTKEWLTLALLPSCRCASRRLPHRSIRHDRHLG